MSMSQEDIEALMNGLDIPAQDSVETIKEEPVFLKIRLIQKR